MRRTIFVLAALVAASTSLAQARTAHAFCGFYVAPPGDKPLYNDASLVALMREGTRTVMSMSNNYKGPAKNFAMVVPVPVVLQKDNVRTLSPAAFEKLEKLTAPRLVEYWETDPCDHPCADADLGSICGVGYGAGYGGLGMGSGGYSPVTIEAKFSVGEYDIVILGAKDSDSLEKWLKDNGYAIPDGAAAALAPYVKEQQKFFVAKVDVKKVKMDKAGVAVLSPLRIAFESPDFRLPVRLGLLNAQAKQDLIVFVLSPDKRYDVANYPNVFAPTNLEVTNDARKSFAPFYATLFDASIAQVGGRAIVTEYAWESSSCDPCPTPPLEDDDVATLGGDVIYGDGAGKMKVSKKGNTSMVITRLHARYDRTSLDEDLIFRAAPPITGGREDDVGDGTIATTAQPSSYNNFQARYVIRHLWTGPIGCKNPQRGAWGDRPAWMKSAPDPTSATGLAGASRGTVQLASVLKGGMPKVEIVTASSFAEGGDDGGDGGDAGGDAATSSATSDASFTGGDGSTMVPPVPPGPRGCGCAIPGKTSPESTSIAWLSIALGSALFERRRSHKR